MLYHRYEFDERGIVRTARLIPPTAQSQRQIESDLRAYAPRLNGLSVEEATSRCESLGPSYDPCISCSAHALR
jgi:sulfhydrogenase subunit alpha